jgi:hypothetical protein
MSLAERVRLADDIVREFLVRRGFAAALDAFEEDRAADALQGLQARRIRLILISLPSLLSRR